MPSSGSRPPRPTDQAGQQVVAFFAMRQEGHFDSLLPLVSRLARRGLAPHVFTHADFRERVERAGGTFVDLFAKYPLEPADDESLPAPCRHVSFAGRYAEAISRDLEAIQPSLVVYDAHAVIGRVVAVELGIPYVSVCPAHNVSPARLPRLIETLPAISISPACERGVEVLQRRYGLTDASPFAFASWLSPYLNLYGEPAEYLTEAEQGAMAPVAFSGCLPEIDEIESRRGSNGPVYFEPGESRLKIYVSFGTVVWRYFPSRAVDAVRTLSDSLAAMGDEVTATISIGGANVTDEFLDAHQHPNVSVLRYVDQWKILGEADAFVTHNGLKSTHEAVFNRVPMISYPFFWDQPALAEKCQSLDLAMPLMDSAGVSLQPEDLQRAIGELASNGNSLQHGLERAREWELELIADRGSVLDRIVALIPS